MTAKTPGQVNYEAFQAARYPGVPGGGWSHPAAAKARPAWEKSAQAVIGHAELTHDEDLKRERDELRLQLAELRAERDRYRERFDEFGRVKIRLSALVASLDETVTRCQNTDSEFDMGAAHSASVDARQIRQILDDTALGTTPEPELTVTADVHVDWHMTPDEWGQLSGVLASHGGVPYIAQLIADGKLPADAAPPAIVHFYGELSEADVAELREEFSKAVRTGRPRLLTEPVSELAAAMAETREVRAVAAEVLDMAEGQIEGRTHIRLAEIAEWRKRAGIGADR